jgi:hypothetical protein
MGEIPDSERGCCSLLIYGDRINFERIKLILNLEPTRIARKGAPQRFASLGVSKTNEWFLDFDFEHRDELSQVLRKLLLAIYPNKEKLKDMLGEDDDTEILFKIYVASDYSQMSFDIEPDVLSLLAEFGFPVYFSHFSWGKAEGSTWEKDD